MSPLFLPLPFRPIAETFSPISYPSFLSAAPVVPLFYLIMVPWIRVFFFRGIMLVSVVVLFVFHHSPFFHLLDGSLPHFPLYFSAVAPLAFSGRTFPPGFERVLLSLVPPVKNLSAVIFFPLPFCRGDILGLAWEPSLFLFVLRFVRTPATPSSLVHPSRSPAW